MKKLGAIFAAVLFALAATSVIAKEDKAADKQPVAEAKGKKSEEKLDINTATDKELAALPGIGQARAAAIIKGRPYKGKDELVEKKILTKTLYDKIKERIIAKQ